MPGTKTFLEVSDAGLGDLVGYPDAAKLDRVRNAANGSQWVKRFETMVATIMPKEVWKWKR